MSKHKTIYDNEYRAVLNRLVQERKRLGLSQHEVAELTNLNQSEISKIENFERRLDVLEFKKMLMAYRINTNEPLSNFVKSFFKLEP
jgi:transcriptional regulator with XRE-family HTH domain